MFKKSDKDRSRELDKQEISTIIGEGFNITGEVRGSSVIRIDGRITGNVNVQSGIILGETGMIDGDLDSDSAIIYGTVTGNIDCGQLEVKSSARVEGDIQTDNIQIEMGAQLNGKLAMKKQNVYAPNEERVEEGQLQKAI